MDDISEIAHLNKLLEEERQKRKNDAAYVAEGLKPVMRDIKLATEEILNMRKRIKLLEEENRRLLTENAELRER